MIFVEELEQYKNRSKVYYNRYCNFILSRVDREIECGVYYETHHILPISIFPEYEKSEWNLIKLTGREHYIAHWMLAKLIGGNMWFAFNMMSRIIPSKSSFLYERARKYISQVISESNTGRQMSEELKIATGERFKGKLNAVDMDGNVHHIDVNDPRYLSGELVHIRVGYTHKQSTIEKMSENSHMRGKRPYHNTESGEFGYFNDDNIPEGWVYGFSDEIKQKNSHGVSQLRWFHDPETKVCVRAKEKPDGYVEGRVFENVGFALANEMINVVDLKNRVCTKVNSVENYHSSASGRSTDKTLVFRVDNYVFTSATSLLEYLNNKGIYIDHKNLTDLEKFNVYVVPKPHGRCNVETNEFRKEKCGETMDSLGVECYNLLDFELREGDVIWKQA